MRRLEKPLRWIVGMIVVAVVASAEVAHIQTLSPYNYVGNVWGMVFAVTKHGSTETRRRETCRADSHCVADEEISGQGDTARTHGAMHLSLSVDPGMQRQQHRV